jgi:LuxR family maltose regulon positive regulatory protein
MSGAVVDLGHAHGGASVVHAGSQGVASAAPGRPFDFVASKVRVPTVALASVPRIGLVNRLRATTSSSVVVVGAPAGYGKTTLLAQWAMRDDRPFAWISIDAHDNDPVILLRHIAIAVSGVGPLEAAVFAGVRSHGRSVRKVRLPELAAAVAALEHPFVMVLDDADLLESQESLAVITTLAEQIPQGSTLVLSGRAEPRLGIARLRAGGRLVEIGAEMLAMSRREAHLLLRATGLELTDAEVADLLARTEGWPAGLYLAALALRGREAGPGRSASITGENRFVAEYLRTEHLADFDPDMVTFLLRTSVLDKMCGSLCDAVLETEGSGQRLESMRASNMLLVPLDDHCEWYRYHHLLEELLRHDLDQADAADMPTLNRRAADWYEAHGQPESALERAAESGDVDRVARIFTSVALPMYHAGRVTAIEGWLRYFGDDAQLARFPAVAVLGSWIHALRGRPAAAEHWLRTAESGPPEARLPDGSGSVRSWVAALRAAMCRDGAEQMRSDAEDALVDLPRDSPLRPAALMLHGAAHVLLGELEHGDLILAAAADEAMLLGAADTHLLALSERSLVAGARGDNDGADRLAVEARDLIVAAHLDDYPTTAVALAACARARLRHGRWDEARSDLITAHHLTQSLADAMPWLAVQAKLELARARGAARPGCREDAPDRDRRHRCAPAGARRVGRAGRGH